MQLYRDLGGYYGVLKRGLHFLSSPAKKLNFYAVFSSIDRLVDEVDYQWRCTISTFTETYMDDFAQFKQLFIFLVLTGYNCN
jgi:hypothetical protein